MNGRIGDGTSVAMVCGIVSQLEQRAIVEPMGLLRLTLLDRDVRSFRQGNFATGLSLI
jgi:hypothetical protein